MRTKLIKATLLVIATVTLSLLSYHTHRTWDYDASLHCPEKMVFLEDIGRFGNKFWEYLAARIISQAQQTQLYVTKDLSKFFNRYFKDLLHAEAVNVKHFRKQCNANLWEQVFLNVTDISSPLPTWSHIHDSYPLDISPHIWSMIFQYRSQLLQEFQFKPEFLKRVQDRMQKIIGSRIHSTLIGVHVRLTDFIRHNVWLNGGFNQAQKPYFDQAMKYFREKFDNPMFLVVSDDVDWCRQNFIESDIVFAGNRDENDPGWDLAILKSCDHLILTYGTFTTTAGYFSEGEIIIADGFSRRADQFNERIKAVHPTKWKWLTITNSTVL